MTYTHAYVEEGRVRRLLRELPRVVGRVSNFHTLDPAAQRAAGYYPLVGSMPTPGPFQTVGNPSFSVELDHVKATWPLETTRREAIAAARWAEVKALRAQKLAEGFVFAGHRFQADPDSTSLITSVVTALTAGIIEEPPPWTTADNESVQLTSSDFVMMAATALAFVNVIHETSRSIRTALESSDAPEHFDITAGWPTADKGVTR